MTRTRPTGRHTAALALALTLTVGGLAGCGSSPSEPDEDAQASSAAAAPTEDGGEQDAVTAQEEALDAYVKAAQPQIAKAMEAYDGTYADFSFTAIPPSTVEYSYTFAEPVDPNAAVETFDSSVATLQATVDSVIIPEMERAGITDPKVVYTYYDADGSELWTKTFEAS
jgi:hypothetical protein